MNETRRLAEFVAQERYEDLPEAVVEATRVFILDNLASGLVGSFTPWADMVGKLAVENGGPRPCSVFARNWTTSPSYAALVNGTMIGGFETDHAFVPGSCHPSAAVFPSALAAAEREHLDGKAFLTAVALGYEVCCRVGAAATRAVEDAAGFHGPGTNASFGGAAGAARALWLTVEQITNALGIAGSHAGGLMEFVPEGAMTKRIHVGRGAQMGLESALLAGHGFTGPSTVLEGDRGFLRVYSPSPRPELLVEGLGEHYVLMGIVVKTYACHASFHPVIEGICKFKGQEQYDLARVKGVKVVATERMIDRHGQREPTSILGAQYSLPFSAAVALCSDITNPLVYNESTLWDPRVRELARSMDLSVNKDRLGKPGGPVAEVSVTVAGKTHDFSVSQWKGATTNPYSFDEMADKFRHYAAISPEEEPATKGTKGPPKWKGLSPDRIEAVVQKVRDLEGLKDLRELTRLVRG